MRLRLAETMTDYRQHLSSDADLVTGYEAVRAGFVALALEKIRRATPFVAQARALQTAAAQVQTPGQLVSLQEIQAALLTAAGVSDKAAKHLQAEDEAEAIQGLVGNFLEPAGEKFVEELVFRFLLTRGDTLGGSMRNIGGFMAQTKLTRALLATLNLAGTPCLWLDNRTNIWLPVNGDEADIELFARGLSWQTAQGPRSLIYNLTVPLVKNNVDLCLLACDAAAMKPTVYGNADLYLALGELKGGIDPAGADEHWKTARTALQRIREAFAAKGIRPHTFFVGAAIEKKMAAEIWGQLNSGILANAANLTNANQLAAISRWLCNI
jgi:hypothetical protein